MNPDPRAQRTKMIVLLVIFFLPLAVAFWLYYGSGWRPLGNTSHGQLLLPIRTVPQDLAVLHGKWALVHLTDAPCGADCQRALVFARQTRLSLNQDAARVSRVLLAPADCCDPAQLDAQHPGLVRLDPATLADGGAALRSAFPPDGHADALYVVDPLGNVVLRFDIDDKPKDLLNDLKKLLKLSSIG